MSRRNPTPEEEIINKRAKGEITAAEAKCRLRRLYTMLAPQGGQ